MDPQAPGSVKPTTYVVSFSTKNEATRLKVCDTLRQYGSYCPIHNTCWAISTTATAVAVRDRVRAVLESSDSVFVVRSGIEAAWHKSYGDANNNWLKEML